jgi:tetratricopeptide (TPR) repeat protein
MSSAGSASNRSLGIGWRESNRISPASLAQYIHLLEVACQRDSNSADLRTCLGIAQATNYEIHKSMESFQTAIRLDPTHFFARFKYAGVLSSLGSLQSAEEETRKAVELASTPWELAMARRQLQAIGNRLREESQ